MVIKYIMIFFSLILFFAPRLFFFILPSLPISILFIICMRIIIDFLLHDSAFKKLKVFFIRFVP